jgi:tryptophanyl-tRNA synthetase
LKKQLAEDMENFIAPLRNRIQDTLKDRERVRKAAQMGAQKARASAVKTVADVRKIIGFKGI